MIYLFDKLNFLVDPALPPPPTSVPPVHPLLVPHPDNQLSSGAFSRFRQLGAPNSGTATSLTNPANTTSAINQPASSSVTLAFGQGSIQSGSILTVPAAVTTHQQIAQAAQRNREKKK